MEKERDEPLMIKNDYLLKSELTSRIAFLLFFGWLISISLTPEPDSLDELYRRLTLGTAIFGILWTLFSELKILIKLIREDLYIKIYKDKIFYEYITQKGNKKVDIIKNEEIISKRWALFPYAVKDREIWISEIENTDDRRWAYLFSPFYFMISIIYLFIFILLNKLRIKRYVLYRFKDGVIAIPYNKKIFKENFPFEWRSLINRYISKGGYYAK